MDELQAIGDHIRATFTARSAARDAVLARSRELIRQCAETIRAIHRREWDAVEPRLAALQTLAQDMRAVVADYPDLYHAGYTQDALKEVAEAFLTYAMIRHTPLPTPEALHIEPSAYINGLAEAATELRRFLLDTMRREEAHFADAERLLDWMDAVYDLLVTFDFPDAITGDLRRRTDTVRGVLERTRGDLTTSLREHKLRQALDAFEQRQTGT